MTETTGYDVTGVTEGRSDFIPLAANAPLEDARMVAGQAIGTGAWEAVEIKNPRTRAIIAVYTPENPDPEIEGAPGFKHGHPAHVFDDDCSWCLKEAAQAKPTRQHVARLGDLLSDETLDTVAALMPEEGGS
jgi:hypothetical protein